MTGPFQFRKTVSLSSSVHRRLSKYVSVASAAGVGALALSQLCEAKVVYTPVHTLIASGETVPLDLDNDGIADFSIRNFVDTFEGSTEGFLLLRLLQAGNQPRGDNVYKRAAALPSRSPVWPKAIFVSANSAIMISANATHRCFGPWNNVMNRYLGLKFQISGKTHYGWARLSASCDSTHNHIKALLTGYAYETVPNRPILTGEAKGPESTGGGPSATLFLRRAPQPGTATLGLLALGSPGLSIWRREEQFGF